MKKDHKAVRFLLDNNTYIIFLHCFLSAVSFRTSFFPI